MLKVRLYLDPSDGSKTRYIGHVNIEHWDFFGYEFLYRKFNGFEIASIFGYKICSDSRRPHPMDSGNYIRSYDSRRW